LFVVLLCVFSALGVILPTLAQEQEDMEIFEVEGAVRRVSGDDASGSPRRYQLRSTEFESEALHTGRTQRVDKLRVLLYWVHKMEIDDQFLGALKMNTFGDAEFGFQVKTDQHIATEELQISIPRYLWITKEVVAEDLPFLQSNSPSQEAGLTAWVIYQQYLATEDQGTNWEFYVNSLPTEADSRKDQPWFWNRLQLSELRGSGLEELATAYRDQVKEEYRIIKELFQNEHKVNGRVLVPKSFFTWKKFLWEYSNVLERLFMIPEGTLALIPILDLINHGDVPGENRGVSFEGNEAVVRNPTPLSGDDQLLVSYESPLLRTSWQWLFRLGFVPNRLRGDHVTLLAPVEVQAEPIRVYLREQSLLEYDREDFRSVDLFYSGYVEEDAHLLKHLAHLLRLVRASFIRPDAFFFESSPNRVNAELRALLNGRGSKALMQDLEPVVIQRAREIITNALQQYPSTLEADVDYFDKNPSMHPRVVKAIQLRMSIKRILRQNLARLEVMQEAYESAGSHQEL